jgi:hypothetical protein
VFAAGRGQRSSREVGRGAIDTVAADEGRARWPVVSALLAVESCLGLLYDEWQSCVRVLKSYLGARIWGEV